MPDRGALDKARRSPAAAWTLTRAPEGSIPGSRRPLAAAAVAALVLMTASPSLGHEGTGRALSPPARAPIARAISGGELPGAAYRAPQPPSNRGDLRDAAARPGRTAVGVIILVAALAACAGTARFRRCACVVLGVALVVMYVEIGLHSVHHLSQPGAAQRCHHAAAAVHLIGPANAAEGGLSTCLLAVGHVAPAARAGLPVSLHAPSASRAPPLSLDRVAD